MRTAFLLLVTVIGLRAGDALHFYFIDVEEGSSTLIVAPSGQNLLVDAGSRGNHGRDVRRVMSALNNAGANCIDYLLVTHYHNDHYGAVAELAAKVPVRHIIDHGPSVEAGKDTVWQKHWEISVDDKQFAEYCAIRDRVRYTIARAGDRIPIRGVDVLVLASGNDTLTHALPGGGQANPYCAITPLRSEDETEDGQSIGILVSFGKFRFLSMGDRTWNRLWRFFCPNNPVGTVDVYMTSHHAMSIDKEIGGEVRWGRSGTPEVEVCALRPRVAILNYGERYHRLGTPRGWQVVRNSPGLEDFWQLHYQIGGGPENNVPEHFIANLSAQECQGHWIKLSAHRDGSFTVINRRNGYRKDYKSARESR
jgi:beta-lactamase superfamily II metal-dependent hydrolase